MTLLTKIVKGSTILLARMCLWRDIQPNREGRKFLFCAWMTNYWYFSMEICTFKMCFFETIHSLQVNGSQLLFCTLAVMKLIPVELYGTNLLSTCMYLPANRPLLNGRQQRSHLEKCVRVQLNWLTSC